MGGYSKSTVVPTKEAGVELIQKFVASHTNKLAWAVLMQTDETFTVWERTSQPCYGEMREYGCKNPNLLPAHQRKVSKPGDLVTPFPDGVPVAIGVPFFVHFGSKDDREDHAVLMDTVLNPETSPWRGALKEFTPVRDNQESITGIVLTDTDIDPTLMVSLWMNLRGNLSGIAKKRFAKIVKFFPDKNRNVLLLSTIVAPQGYAGASSFMLGSHGGYYLALDVVVPNFINGVVDPAISDGTTFRGRGAYNRPDLHNIFGRTQQSIAKGLTVKLGPAGLGGSYPETRLNEVVEYIESLAA